MSFAAFNSFACRCGGKLDLYEQFTLSTAFNLFYRRSSAVDSGDAPESTQWFITPETVGVTKDTVATWTNQVFEVVQVSATFYLARFDVVSQTVVWSKTLSSTPDTDRFILWAGPDHAGVVRNPAGDSYEIWDADGNLDYRDGFTAGRGWSPRLNTYTNTDVLEGVIPIPTNVSRWNYPACVGWRIINVVIEDWYEGPFGNYRADVECDYQLVAGEVKWTDDDGPTMSVDTVLEEYHFTSLDLFAPPTADPAATTDEERDAALKQDLMEWLNDGTGGGFITSPFPDVGLARIRAAGAEATSPWDLDKANRQGAGVVGYEKHMDGTHGYIRSKPGLEHEVRLNGSLVDTLPVGFAIFEEDVVYSFISVPSDSVYFVVSWLNDDTGFVTVRAYGNAGGILWTQQANIEDGRGQAMCASDRYIYVANFPLDWPTMVGDNLPLFTSSGKTQRYGSGNWADWAVSLDGTRWNPARQWSSEGYRERFVPLIAALGHVDCIKNSEAIPFCPPDDWF